jgi:hypothetical protein
MGGSNQIDLDYVVSHCEKEADDQKMMAAYEGRTAFSSAKDHRKRDEHLAKSQMADQLAHHFRTKSQGHLRSNPEIDGLAREIDPEAFSSYEELLAKIMSEGGDESYAMEVARATYGDRMDVALEQAGDSISTQVNNPDDSQEYDKGTEDVAKWHEQRALEAERQEQLETVPARKAKYAQRAKRHRLYAKHIRHDFAEARELSMRKKAREMAQEQPQLPLATPQGIRGPEMEEGIPLAVQRAFRKKSEVFDDEGFT